MNPEFPTSSQLIVFTTRDYAQLHDISVPAASRRLCRLESNTALTRLTRGVWANTDHPYFNPLACVPILLNREQGCISFLTALHRHGMISQIPAAIQIATTGHPRKLRTPVANYEFFQLKPELFRLGIDWINTHPPALMASPEKALFDTFYLATRRGQRFARLPELDLTAGGFSPGRFRRLLRELSVPRRIQSAIEKRFDSLPGAAV